MENGIVMAIMVPHPPLIVPEVGRGGEGKIQETTEAYKRAAGMLAECKPDTVVVISPHQIMYADYFHISPRESAKGSFAGFDAPQVKFEVEYDSEFVAMLCGEAELAGLPAGTLGEKNRELDHGTMVPLYFVNPLLQNYKLVRIGLSGLPLMEHYEFGRCIKRAAEKSGKKIAIIASGDLSHRLKADGPYGYKKEGPEYDKRIMDVMGRAAFDELFDFTEDFCDSAGECGHRSFTIMAGALDRTGVEAQKLSYQGVTGVGYGVCAYSVTGCDPDRNFGELQRKKFEQLMVKHREKEDAYVRFARQVIEKYVNEKKLIPIPKDLPEEFYNTKAGAFVSIKENGKLRGCIGTISAAFDNLAEEIRGNAISASTRDPRFYPITSDELDKLVITVDVLGDAEEISSPEELDVIRYGVIVTKGAKRGLLLPNLDGVDSVEEQIRIAKQKAGIGEAEEVKLERFEVVRHY